MKQYLPIILRFFLVAIVLQVGRELEVDKQLGGIVTALITLFGVVWVFRGKRVFTYRFGQNIGESKDKKRNYTFIIGLVVIVLVGYIIVTLQKTELSSSNELVMSDAYYEILEAELDKEKIDDLHTRGIINNDEYLKLILDYEKRPPFSPSERLALRIWQIKESELPCKEVVKSRVEERKSMKRWERYEHLRITYNKCD